MSASQSDSPVPQPGLDAVAPPISHEIYGMPAFVSFAVRDVVATRSWYTEGLDFVDLFSFPAPDSTPVLVHLRRWKFQGHPDPTRGEAPVTGYFGHPVDRGRLQRA